jgi:hypothetical protein
MAVSASFNRHQYDEFKKWQQPPPNYDDLQIKRHPSVLEIKAADGGVRHMPNQSPVPPPYQASEKR